MSTNAEKIPIWYWCCGDTNWQGLLWVQSSGRGMWIQIGIGIRIRIQIRQIRQIQMHVDLHSRLSDFVKGVSHCPLWTLDRLGPHNVIKLIFKRWPNPLNLKPLKVSFKKRSTCIIKGVAWSVGLILIYFLAFRPCVCHSLSCRSCWTYGHDFWHERFQMWKNLSRSMAQCKVHISIYITYI